MANVKVYTTPTCIWCAKTKEFLSGKKIKFKEIDVSKSEKAAQEMVERSGQMGVPVIDINGEIIVGFDQVKMEKALKKAT